jgi:Flp pilus assembly protein TadG
MRMIASRLRRVESADEGGAVLVMVAIALVALLGMVVLTVDVGGLAVKRRFMVNANDAAALAAAEAFATQRDLAAQGDADSLATQNVANAVHDTSQPWWTVTFGLSGSTCLPTTCGSVTVRYQGNQSLPFAPIIGLGGATAVRAEATAIWGPAGGGSPAPIMVRSDWLGSECAVPVTTTTPAPVECDFWLNDHDDNGNPLWAWLNLNPLGSANAGWNVPRFYNCPNVPSGDRTNWIKGIDVPPLPVNPIPTPTFVCTVSGHASANFADMQTQLGKFKVFPINDSMGALAPPGQVDKDGNYCPPSTPCTPDKYDVVGFTVLRLDNVMKGNDPAAIGDPGGTGACSPSHTFTISGAGKTWDLDNQACNTTGLHYPADLSKLYPKISNSTGTTVFNGGVTGSCGTDYCYDPATKVITWLKAIGAKNATVAWEYVIPPTKGACGIHASDPNAICLIASWQGPQGGGSNPGGGVDFGLRAIRLAA